MKKHTFTLLIGWLLLLTSNLMAQNKEGRLKLKEGDWFEVAVEQNDCDGGITNYLLRYQLMKQLQNKIQQYQITIEHYKVITQHELDHPGYDGYDSYYPTFEENKQTPDIKNQYVLEVTPNGGFTDYKPVKSNYNSKIVLTSINPSDGRNVKYSYIWNKYDSLMIPNISKILMLPNLGANINLTNEVNRIPLIVEQPTIQLHLTNASFPLPANAIIKGKLKDQLNQAITICLNGENAASYFPEQQFKTKEDGSFECAVFLKRPFHLNIKIGDKHLTSFLEPGDTLNINALSYQAREIYYNQYADTKPNEYFPAGVDKSKYFSGTAAYNTMLSNELDQYREGFSYEHSVEGVIAKQKELTNAVENLISSYQGKASENCIEYFQMDFQYFLAVSKLYFKEQNELPELDSQRNFIGFKKFNYPKDFFMEVDTLPILMLPFEWNYNYQNFIKRAQIFKQNRLGWSVRKTATDNFMENYYFSLASLRGYPLYQQIAYYMDQELRKGSDINNVKPYYYNFLINCGDPALTEPLKKNYENAERIAIGKPFPFDSFVLPDSTIFNLAKFKGKPICLVLFNGSKQSVNEFKDNIEKFKTEEVEFVFIRSNGGKWMDKDIDSSIVNRPDVTYLELSDKFFKSQLLLERTRIFMLDKWFRIVENNAEDPMTHIYKGGNPKFDMSLRKAIDAKRYSKAEQSSILKTAGWSLGSILFTLLVGWWIYRIRIRQIKQQEEAKRRIKELEIKAIRSQMNPHFIFNALNSIQSLINGNQFKEANIYLSKFAVLLRGVLNNSEKSRVSLSDELQAVELYCQLEQLRFDFHFDISIAEDVNGDLIEIPGMIIQPLAENAVVHGISAKGNEGKLNIQVSRQNGNVCIGVADNGVGLTSQVKDTLSQKGFGLKLVEERINILNLEGKEARLTLRNRENNSGTLATLIIPID